MVEALYAHLVAGNIAALARLFPQIAALDTPLSGAVDGDEALAAYVAREGAC